jgi:protocatechuate 3,4-dioxygenase beta subunit
MYKIIDVFGCAHKKLMTFEEAIKTLNSDMYLSDKDIAAAKNSDKFSFIYGFKSCHIERVVS